MNRAATAIIIAAGLAVATLPDVPAQAAAARTFVSAAGSDSNNCTNVATPCRHLATAYAATAANGEIYVLDPANYGSLTITGPVSIEGHGWASIAPVSGSAAITINANTGDKINIIGVVLDGTALTSTNGIVFNSGSTLTVRDSVIRDFGTDGIDFLPNTSSPSQLSVSNTLVSDNGRVAIFIEPTGLGTVTVVLDHVKLENSVFDGLRVGAPSNQTTNLTLSDSVSANNIQSGIGASGAGTQNIMVRNSTIANNNIGLNAGPGATIWVTRSTIAENSNGVEVSGTGSVISYSDNNIVANTNGNAASSTTGGYQ